MNKLYPLKFKPIFKDKIWGGDKIKTVLGKDFSPLPNCGEVWVLSGVEGNQTIVENGFLAGNELNELIEVYMDDLVGEKVFDKFRNEFPVLIKFIDAKDWLSIQVHPDDELAKQRKIGSGKTEMWYIMDAEENSELISGFNKKLTKEEYLEKFKTKKLKEVLNYENTKKGDVFFMPSGRVHALGPGIMLAEIQQTSDTTYRIYDWDRVDDKGNSRELHTEEALDAFDFNHYDSYRTEYKKEKNKTVEVVECPYFKTNVIELTSGLEKNYSELDSFVIYVCVEGSVNIEYPDGSVLMNQGDAVLIPAEVLNISLIPKLAGKLLEVYIV